MAFTPENLARAREIVARYPVAKSATLPLLHLAQEQDGWIRPEAMEEIAGILGCSTSTGWVHLHRARKRLGALLTEEVGNDVH